MIIALDTNFLVYCAKQKVDFLQEIYSLINSGYKIIVLQQVIEELKKLSREKKIADRKAAILALAMVEKYMQEGKIKIKKIYAKDADSALLTFDKKDAAIATLDSELKKKFKHARFIIIRQLKHLKFG